MKRHDIDTLAKRVLTPVEYNNIINIASRKENIFDNMADFDSKLGGAGIHNINQGKTGRYNGKDRDVYRPIQYIYSYIQMDSEQVEWVTREIIHMCGLHLESLIKRLTRITRLPLGQSLTLSIVRTKLDNQTFKNLKVIINPYNDAKHRLDHDKDTHLFDIESALLCYAATRKIAKKIIPLASLYTPLCVWD
jgi:hypothetical protein